MSRKPKLSDTPKIPRRPISDSSWMMEDNTTPEEALAKPKRNGALSVHLTILKPEGERKILTALDTFADWNVLHPSVAQAITDEIRRQFSPRMKTWLASKEALIKRTGCQEASACGGSTRFREFGAICLKENKGDKEETWVPGFVADENQLPRNHLLLLNPDTIREIGLSVDKLLEARENKSSTMERKSAQKMRKWKRTSRRREVGETNTACTENLIQIATEIHDLKNGDNQEDGQVFLSEAQVADFLKRHPDGKFTDVKTTLADALVGDDLTQTQKEKFWTEIEKRKAYFSDVKSYAKTNNHPPWVIPLKEGAVPVRLPMPRWGQNSAKAQLLRMWADRNIEQGTWEMNNRAKWVQYLHIAGKSKLGKDDPDPGVRICGAYMWAQTNVN